MASIIKLKRSSTPSSVPTGLAEGEIAVNLKDKILYVGNTTGSVAMSGSIATTAEVGVASFDSGDFAVSGAGAVTVKNGGIDNGQLAADAVTGAKIADDAIDSEHITDGSIDTVHIADSNVTTAKINDSAVTSAKIAAKTIVAGDIADGTITATQLAASAVVANTIATNSIALGTKTTGNYVATVSGTTNEIEVSGSGSETAGVTVGLPNDVTISNDLTVSNDVAVAGNVTVDGNMTVEGAVTYISSSTVNVDDSAIKLSANNAADTVDIGMYGKYVDGGTATYAGWHRDASASGVFKFYKDLTSEPAGTVDTSHASYAMGTIEAIIDGGTY